MYIDVSDIDLNSSYTIQFVNKRTEAMKDIPSLKGIAAPGEHRVNYAQELGWVGQGIQSFTINIWISGEGKSMIVKTISITSK